MDKQKNNKQITQKQIIMKRTLLSLFAVLTALFSYAGDGTKQNPMTVADVLAASMDESTVWVKAYIVGNINGSKM